MEAGWNYVKSNGPGDPSAMDDSIEKIKELLASKLPAVWNLLRASVIIVSVWSEDCKDA